MVQDLLLLEFEVIFAICAIFVVVLMYLFYVKYSYDKDQERQRKPEGART
jgi:heme/copper-type cytochrome/quinol oxidase subunit 2